MKKALRERVLEWAVANRDIVGEAIRANSRRMPIISAICFLVHMALAFNFVFFVKAADAGQILWRKEIITGHVLQTGFYALLCLVTHAGFYKKATQPVNRLLQALFLMDTMAAGIAFTSIDQRVTTNITPFLVASIICALAIYYRPFVSLLLGTASFVAFLAAIGIHQYDPAVLESNQVNGLAIAAIAIGLSILLWTGYAKTVKQQRIIAQANLEMQEMNVRLAFLASHDALTGLFNRTRFEEHVVEEINRIQRYGGSAAMMLFDIDDFKPINDQYGHPTGDQAIRHVATIVHDNLRVTDIVARWGGEEFSVLLPESSREESGTVAEKIRSRVEENPFVGRSGDSIRITVSVGVAMLNMEALDPLVQAYQEADAALYRAKRSGKNRVFLLAPTVDPTGTDESV